MQQFKLRTSERLRPLPPGRWAITQRWNDFLFAHWRVSAAQVTERLPRGLVADTFDGSAWLGVVPFWMDRIKVRGVPPLPGSRSFPELNLRTYVRDVRTGTPGMYFFSLDGPNLLAVLAARSFYHLPYYWAGMQMRSLGDRGFAFSSRRRFSARPVAFEAHYRSLGPASRLVDSPSGTLEYFLAERYSLFTQNAAGALMRISVHHVSWPLEEARAEIRRNDLPAVLGIELAEQKPVLHYARRMAVYLWPPELVAPAPHRHRIPAQVMPLL